METFSTKVVALIAFSAWAVLPATRATAYPQDSNPGTSPISIERQQVVPSAQHFEPKLNSVSDRVIGPSDYVIGPEDILDIDVFDFPELTKTVRVTNEGSVALPLLGRVQAAGFTSQEFRKELESRYAQTYLNNPQVTVGIKEFHARPVSVIGAVEKPGLFQVTGRRKLIEMLSLAGGPSKTAGRTVLVTREGGFGSIPQVEGMHLITPEQVEINLRRLLYSQSPALNIEIKPLDTISVSTAVIVYVVGAVNKPGGFAMEDQGEVSVLQALAMAGGLEGTASKRRARIIRRGGDGMRVEIPLNLGKILNGKSKDVEMAANDILFVPSSAGKNAAKTSAQASVGVISGLIIYGRI
jgi:polysaccharide export outer membrane protein